MKLRRIATVLALILLSSLSFAQPKYWTWCHYSPDRDWDAYLTELKDVGVTGLLLSASKEGYERVVPLANKYGVEVHAWLWIMNNGGIAAEHPEWLDYNREGNSLKEKRAYIDYYKFLNPAASGVQEAIVEHIDKIAQVEGLKGISLDYCRYVDAILPTGLWKNYGIVQDKVYPKWDYGYHPEMIVAFKKRYGYDPRSQSDSSLDEKWHQFRMDKVNEVVAKLGEVARKRGVEITASPFPTPQMSREMVYQDWGQWELDRAFPMIYHGFYYGDLNWIAQCIQDCIRDRNPKTEIYLGTYIPDYKNNKTFSLIDAIEVALKNGARGVALFTFDQLDSTQKASLKEFIRKNQ